MPSEELAEDGNAAGVAAGRELTPSLIKEVDHQRRSLRRLEIGQMLSGNALASSPRMLP
jgi:hypothetical protein